MIATFLVVSAATAIPCYSQSDPQALFFDATNPSARLATCTDGTCTSPPQVSTVATYSEYNHGLSQMTFATPLDGRPAFFHWNPDTKVFELTKCGNDTCGSGNQTTTIASLDVSWVLRKQTAVIFDGNNPILIYPQYGPIPDSPGSSGWYSQISRCFNASCSSGMDTELLRNASGNIMHVEFVDAVMGTDGKPLLGYVLNNGHLVWMHCGNLTCSTNNVYTEVTEPNGSFVYDIEVKRNQESAQNLPYALVNNSGALFLVRCLNSTCTNNSTEHLNPNQSGTFGGFGSLSFGDDGLPVLATTWGEGNCPEFPSCLVDKPRDVVATTLNNSQIKLDWTESSLSLIIYKVYFANGQGEPTTLIETVPEGTSSYTVDNLNSNTIYRFVVTTETDDGAPPWESEPSNLAAAKTASPSNIPPMVSAIQAVAQNSSTVQVTWASAGAGYNYNVYRSEGFFTPTELVGVNVSGTSFLQNCIEVPTTYTYSVRATANGVEGALASGDTVILGNIPFKEDRWLATYGGYKVLKCDNASCSSRSSHWIHRTIAEGGSGSNQDHAGGKPAIIPGSTGPQLVYQIEPAGTEGYDLKHAQCLNGACSCGFETSTFVQGGDVGQFLKMVGGTANSSPDPPLPPSNLQVSGTTQTSVSLTWTASPTNNVVYRIYRGSGGYPNQLLPQTTTQTQFTDNNLSPGTLYSYRVVAYKDGLESSDSNIVTATTDSSPEPPNAPYSLQVTNTTETSLSLSWLLNMPPTVTSINLYLNPTSQAGCTQFIGSLNGTPTQHTFINLSPGTSYRLGLRAVNSDGVSSCASIVATTATAPEPPNAPFNLTVTQTSETEINLAWQLNIPPTVSGVIFYADTLAGSACGTQVGQATGPVTQHLFSALDPGTDYRLGVRAYNQDGTSPCASIIASTDASANPPMPPFNLNASNITTSSLLFTWQTTTPPVINLIRVYVNTQSQSACQNQVATLGGSATSHPVSGLSPGTTYRLGLRTGNNDGVSPCVSILATTQALPNPPNPPINLTVTEVTTSSIAVSWQLLEPPVVNSVRVFLDDDVAPACSTLIDTIPPTQLDYEYIGLLPNTRYRLGLKAVNNDGESACTSRLITTLHTDLPPSPPTDLTAVHVESNRIELAWTPSVSTDVSRYRLYRAKDNAELTVFDEVDVNEHSYVDETVAGSTTYRYAVSAIDLIEQESGISNIIDVETLASDSDVPDNPDVSEEVMGTSSNPISANANAQAERSIQSSSCGYVTTKENHSPHSTFFLLFVTASLCWLRRRQL